MPEFESKDVGWPEASGPMEKIWTYFLGKDKMEEVRVYVTYPHDLLYKNKGVLTRDHTFTNPHNGLSCTVPAGIYTRQEADEMRLTTLLAMNVDGHSIPTWLIYTTHGLNRSFGGFVWKDVKVRKPDVDRRKDTGK